MPKDATLIEQYDVKCNKKCELITYDYDKTFFVVKNKKEGYIYNTLTKKAIDVGPHDKLNMISVNKDDQMVKIGYILTKNDNEISYHFLSFYIETQGRKQWKKISRNMAI